MAQSPCGTRTLTNFWTIPNDGTGKGSYKAGETMIKKKGMPITGARPQYSKKAPLVPDAKDTSADAQTMIREAPQPFKNRMATAQMPAPTNQNYRADQQQFHKDNLRYGGTGRTNSVKDKHTVPYGDVGYSNGPYQSKRGLHSVNDGSPLGAERQAGEINLPGGPKSKSSYGRAMQSMNKIGLGKAYEDFKRYGG
jgi:hypothetical protein